MLCAMRSVRARPIHVYQRACEQNHPPPVLVPLRHRSLRFWPGKKDGRTAAWVDGKLVMDFPNLRLRDIPELKIDHLQIGLFVGPGQHTATRKWYDNVVAAKSYIGPLKKKQ